MSPTIKIDIWADIACPWCYIGKRNLEAGVAAFRERHPGAEVEIELHSFELAPETPVEFEGSEIDFLVGHKGMPEDEARALIATVTAKAAEAGLAYDYEAIRHTKTVKAHQVLHYAKERGKQLEATERLMSAYFAEGRHLGRDEELADLAADVGLDRDDVLRSLGENEHLGAVIADQQQAVANGIRVVPFFVFDGRYAISGAHPPANFVRALEQLQDERKAAA